MTIEDAVRTVLLSAGEQRQPRPAPVDELLLAGRRARRKRRGRLLGGLAATVAALVAGGVGAGLRVSQDVPPAGHGSPGDPSASHPVPLADHGSLTDREFSVAVHLARKQADRFATSIVSASATVESGTLTGSHVNVGHPCTSGTLLRIKLIGRFHGIVVGGDPGLPAGPVHAILITADPRSGLACEIGVQTGQVKPAPGAVILFTH